MLIDGGGRQLGNERSQVEATRKRIFFDQFRLLEGSQQAVRRAFRQLKLSGDTGEASRMLGQQSQGFGGAFDSIHIFNNIVPLIETNISKIDTF